MSDPHPAALLPSGAPMAQVRHRKRDATQRLLGDTIMIAEDAWTAPSRLPGWTRAHVATHLARNADAFRRTVNGLLNHTSTRMYPSEATKRRDVEEGSWRSALELQIDLDTTAGQLAAAFDRLDEVQLDEVVVLAPGQRLRAGELPLARLNEVVLHHVDLDCGFTIDDVDDDIARWLLEWNCAQLTGDQALATVELQSTTGWRARLGDAGEVRLVRGSDHALLGWLTHRPSSQPVLGAEDIVP